MLIRLSALALFFVSGFAALLYQVIWQRLLVFFSGADVYSATIVVAAFMAGIGCGSFAGGQLADRVSRGRALALFAAAELSVSAFGFFSKFTFYDVLYVQYGDLARGPLLTGTVLFLALLWPTFFMGASLPLLSRGLTRSVHGAASTIGWLYAVNTGGAALGAFAGSWLVLPQLGLEGSLKVAAALNLVCAVGAWPIAWSPTLGSNAHDRTPTPGPQPSTLDPRAAPHPLLWPALFALSGFIGLSLEIVWFRLLGVMLKSTAFTFGTLLAVYLSGLGLGGGLGSIVASRVRRPATWFLTLQAAAGVYAALSITLFLNALSDGATFEWFGRYFAQYDGVDLRRAILFWRGLAPDGAEDSASTLRAYVLLPALLILPPTVMAGMSFPLLQRVVQHDLREVGRRVGLLLSANVLGSTLGAFVSGLLLLDWLGTAGTLRLLAVVSMAFAAVALLRLTETRAASRLAALALLGALAATIAWWMPANTLLWARLHGATPDRMIIGEDATGLSALRGDRSDFRNTTVFVNGLGQSWVPFGGVHTVLGALPAFVHERPRSAALIGLGSGDTLYALAGRKELDAVTSIEIIGPQLDTLRSLASWQGYPGLTGILTDPRIRHVEGDGRRFLARSGEQFDIVEADALRPHSAYAGNLYSDAYFRLLQRRLAPGGLAVSWAPTVRVLRTFLTVFPYVAFKDQVVMGSDQPIVIDAAAIERRLEAPGIADYYGAAGIDIKTLLKPFLTSEWQHYTPQDDRSPDNINTDLYPRDEFEMPMFFNRPRFLR